MIKLLKFQELIFKYFKFKHFKIKNQIKYQEKEFNNSLQIFVNYENKKDIKRIKYV